MASLARNSLMTDLGLSWSEQTVLQYQKMLPRQQTIVDTATKLC